MNVRRVARPDLARRPLEGPREGDDEGRRGMKQVLLLESAGRTGTTSRGRDKT